MKKDRYARKPQIAFSVDEDSYERFHKIHALEKEKDKITQAQLLCKMMDAYQNRSAPEAEQSITLVKYLQTPFERKSMQKMEFRGTVNYKSNTPTTKPLDSATACKLYEDFRCPVAKLSHAYMFTHCFELYFHIAKGCYVAAERISVSKKPNYCGEVILAENENGPYQITRMPGDFQENPLELSRFRFVSNFDEFIQYFGRYASNDELIALGNILAEDIGDDYQLLDDLF